MTAEELQRFAVIEQRLQELEDLRQKEEDYGRAAREVLYGLLRLLHRRGILRTQDVTAEIRSSAAFAQAAYRLHPPDLLQSMLASLDTVAQAQDQAARDSPE